jgi:hypothetical protein
VARRAEAAARRWCSSGLAPRAVSVHAVPHVPRPPPASGWTPAPDLVTRRGVTIDLRRSAGRTPPRARLQQSWVCLRLRDLARLSVGLMHTCGRQHRVPRCRAIRSAPAMAAIVLPAARSLSSASGVSLSTRRGRTHRGLDCLVDVGRTPHPTRTWPWPAPLSRAPVGHQALGRPEASARPAPTRTHPARPPEPPM